MNKKNDRWVEHGPTAPLDNSESTVSDIAFMKGFDEMVEATIEGKQESIHREQVLLFLDDLVKKWVRQEATAQGYLPEDAAKLGGRIYSFGSFRLGVHNPGADIDTLVLVPELVTSDMFFTTFQHILKNLPEVKELSAVPDATVPLMKMKVKDINIDLLFASMEAIIPDSFQVLEDTILKGVEPSTQRALNGPRVATQMLNCVPNVHTFRSVLRAVKKWANARGVYGNIVGYPGGVAWAILTARVCQLYPNLTAADTFAKMFVFYSSWWTASKDRNRNESAGPIYLTRDLDLDKGYGFDVWNHKLNPRNRNDIFPVITPCYPYMNTCFNVTATTFETILAEFKRGEQLFKEAREVFKEDSTPMDWEKMMAPTEFFRKYESFLRIRVPTTNIDEGRQWKGFVESRLRRLFPQLALIKGLHSQMLPREFVVEEPPNDKNIVMSFNWFIGLDLSEVGSGKVNLETPWGKFMSHVTDCYVDRVMESMLDPELSLLSQKRLYKTCQFALSAEDIKLLPKIITGNKRKREEEKAAEAEELRQREAKLARSLSATSAKRLSADPALPPQSPAQDATTGLPLPSPMKKGIVADSPALRPTPPPRNVPHMY